MDPCQIVCSDLRRVQELVRNKVATLLGLVQKLPDISSERRVYCLNAITGLEEEVEAALIDLERKCNGGK